MFVLEIFARKKFCMMEKICFCERKIFCPRDFCTCLYMKNFLRARFLFALEISAEKYFILCVKICLQEKFCSREIFAWKFFAYEIFLFASDFAEKNFSCEEWEFFAYKNFLITSEIFAWKMRDFFTQEKNLRTRFISNQNFYEKIFYTHDFLHGKIFCVKIYKVAGK